MLRITSVGIICALMPSMAFLFENLDVYKLAVNFSHRVNQFCKSSLKGRSFLADQLRRAALSISLNIAEGSGRWHKRDKRNFYIIARGSTYECVPILEICKKDGMISDNIYRGFRTDIERIGKMISGLINYIEK